MKRIFVKIWLKSRLEEDKEKVTELEDSADEVT